MDVVLVSEQEILELKKFVCELNAIENGVVIVEGKRDSTALRKLGFTGKVLEFHRFTGMIDFADSVSKHERLIILFDRDKKGRTLTGKTIQLLQRRTKVDLSFKRKLRIITKGKIMFIEQLVSYESYLV
ncbi:TOPRIM domain-containing protein [Candidatus Nitrosopumilus sediminis]|uniref:TOPRIM domain-containing protein n=1 Tax=Candidatus Nitrosopumilus sediminis TaxID=1229909 RepID=K0BDW8_9ARCH|nr:TOPRIM domain-containing protein [Candidatus Nitrosopumilus sediminis]